MGWLDFLTAPESADYVTAPPTAPAAPTMWDQFMQLLDQVAGKNTAAPPTLNAGTSEPTVTEGAPRPLPFAQREGAGRTAYQPGRVAGGDFGNILTAGIPNRQPPQVAPIGGYVQGGVARRQNNAGPLAAAALSYLGGQVAGGAAGVSGGEAAGVSGGEAAGMAGEGALGSATPGTAAATGSAAALAPATEGGMFGAAGPSSYTTPTPVPGFWQQFVTQTAKQAGFPDPYKANWTGADYAQTLNTLAKMGGPKRPSTAPTWMQMPQLEQSDEYRNPGPIFGQNIIPSTLDVWRPRMQNTLFPGNRYG